MSLQNPALGIKPCDLLTFITTFNGLTFVELLVSHAELPQEDFVLQVQQVPSSRR